MSGSAPTHPERPTMDEVTNGQRMRALILATVGFAIIFWAWSLLSPLGPVYVEQGLTASSSVLVAVPVIVGSLGRILAGAWTDRWGGKMMLPLFAVITIIPVLFIGFIGQYNYVTLIIGGFFLGVAGTTFAIGVPYVNSWFPPEKRGLAAGIYGMGMIGTAIAAFTTVPLYDIDPRLPFIVCAIALAIFAVVGFFFMQTAPDWEPQKKNIGAQLARTIRIPLTLQGCYLYAISFGGYVAFSVYLPTYLVNEYDLSKSFASLCMAGYVIAAVLMRPVGGILSDRIGAGKTLVGSFTIVLVMALWLSTNPGFMPGATICFLVMAIGFGLGMGATFALVAQRADPSEAGAITGFVGAAGGIAGFVPPLILGALWTARESYSIGILLLAFFTVLALVLSVFIAKATTKANQAAEAADA